MGKNDRVIIKSKEYWGPLKNSKVWQKGKKNGYWYFQMYTFENDKKICIVDNKKDSSGGDFFLESDLELYYKDTIKEFKDNDFFI